MPRILGLDYGTRRVGAALSDPGRTMAFPAEVYALRGPEHDARHYRELVAGERGRADRHRPAAAHQRPGGPARRAGAHVRRLAGRVTGRPVVYFDERYTTVEAEQRLIDAGLTRQKRKALRDQLAAQIMLQGYLDAGCPETEAAAAPLADHRRDRHR